MRQDLELPSCAPWIPSLHYQKWERQRYASCSGTAAQGFPGTLGVSSQPSGHGLHCSGMACGSSSGAVLMKATLCHLDAIDGSL